MSCLSRVFDQCRSENRAAFVSYLCGGDPNADLSLECLRTLIRSGVDILEIGMPFSDPLADGLTNQLAAQRALEAGVTPSGVFQLIKSLKEELPDVPVVIYTYTNLVYHPTMEQHLNSLKAAGADAILTLDLTPEEAVREGYIDLCRKAGLDTVFIAAPTTPVDRLKKITELTTGFLYYVSREGVTGVRDDIAADLNEKLAEIRKCTDLPVAVGFGISQAHHVRQVAAVADAVVVGSALVNVVKEHAANPEKLLSELGAKASSLCQGTLNRS